MQDTVCCGCSVVCDDVAVALKKSELQSLGLCRLGHEFCASILSKTRLIKPLIKSPSGKQKKSTLEAGIARAVSILHQSKNPLFLGWSNSPTEVIKLGLKLAKQSKGVFDGTTSFEYGQLLYSNHHGPENRQLNLDEVRDSADHIVYWGVNPAESHHRHASRYTVFPKGKNIPEGRESRIVSVIDIRETESMRLANHQLILNPIGGDIEFLQMLIAELEGTQESVPERVGGVPAIEFLSFAKQLREADYVALFYGSGLLHSAHASETLPLLFQVERLLNQNEHQCHSLPMVVYCNTIGVTKLMRETTKFFFTIDFTSKSPQTYESLFNGIIHSDFDSVVIMGWDALSVIPGRMAQALMKLPIIAFSTQPTLTTRAADVVFPTALTGPEAGGTVYRMDGTAVTLKPFAKPRKEIPSEADLLQQLLTQVGKA